MTGTPSRSALDALAARPGAALALTRDLVRLPTLGPGEATDAALARLAGELADGGVEVRIEAVSEGVPVLVATLDSGRPGRHLLFQGHVDVVPVDDGWARDPFAADLDGDVLHGRGTCDMKAGLAAATTALRVLREAGGPASGAVSLVVDCDEETGSDRCLLPWAERGGLAPYDLAVCAEPTALQPYLGNRGLVWARVIARGRAAHGGMPAAGRNPIPALARLLAALPEPQGRPGAYGSSGPTLALTTLTAGTAWNSIPDSASATLDRRVASWEQLSDVVSELRAAVAAAPTSDGVSYDLEILKTWPSCLLDEHSDLARAAQRVAQELGAAGDFGYDDACNDASFLAAAGVPTLIWGPGEPTAAHTSSESVTVSDIERATTAYVRLVGELLKDPA